jgi:hypothetical protein
MAGSLVGFIEALMGSPSQGADPEKRMARRLEGRRRRILARKS